LPTPRVVSLHRYPIKSMVGHEVTSLNVDHRGVVGDRLWSARTSDGKIASGKNSRRFAAVPKLLELRAEQQDDTLVITFPDGSSYTAASTDAGARVSEFVGQPMTLAMETEVSHFDDGPLSLIGTASVLALAHERNQPLDCARFRPNVVVETSEPFEEDSWVGHRLQIGTTVLSVTMRSPRCVMIDMETADLPAQKGNLKAIGRLNGANLGVIAQVAALGVIRLGDAIHILGPSSA
jgi:MOSC domain-containing protein